MIDNEKVEEIFLVLEDKLDKTVNVLKDEYAGIRAGRANPHILDKVQVEAYGGMSPLNQLGNISAADARCLVVSPWDKSLLKSIEKAILTANLGINPTNDGNVIRLVFTELTDDRRKELVK
ncbi:MAG: ribosome recycling factor, partial [Clostridia bacterium]|nr:ribosome recycling factor [Clostridia bacterium]